MVRDVLHENPCPTCSGRGTYAGEKCPDCNGSGRIRTEPRVERKSSGGELSKSDAVGGEVRISTDTAATKPPRVTRKG